VKVEVSRNADGRLSVDSNSIAGCMVVFWKSQSRRRIVLIKAEGRSVCKCEGAGVGDGVCSKKESADS
jgi:hypothetical protein